MTPVDRNSEPLDAILRRAMRERPGAATPECADAESLAAYWDKSLAAAERERLEAHFADCARCQTQLASIARADQSARDAKTASAVPWFRRWRIAIPALAAAAVVVFLAMRRPATEEPQNAEVVAMAKHQAPAMELVERAANAPAAPAPAAAPVSPPAAPAPGELAMNETKTQAAAPRAEAMSGNTLHRMDSAQAPGARAMMAPGAAPPNAGTQGFAAGVAGGAAGRAAVALMTIASPDRSVTWIIGRNGLVERRDADSTIHLQHSGVSTDLVAGAAPSATVCWIVGGSGTIIRTTDGEHWARVTAPTAENLIAVSARGANDASITTAGGTSFTTSDGGASWHPQ